MKIKLFKRSFSFFIRLIFPLFVLTMFLGMTACSNTIEAASQENDTITANTIRISIRGDTRIDEAASGYITLSKGKTWDQIKEQVKIKLTLKAAWQGGDYDVHEWRHNYETGAEIRDADTFNTDMIVYAVTNYKKFRIEGTVLKGYTGEKPRGSILLPAFVTEIDEGAFKDCALITGVKLPTNLTSIGKNAFYGCTLLTGEIHLPASLTSIGDNAFYGCTPTGNLKLPASLTAIGKNAFRNCIFLTGTLKLPAELTIIGEAAFGHCTGFTNVDFSTSTKLTEIGEFAFSSCEPLTSIDLSACIKLTKIDARAFYNCTKAEVKLPESITSIDTYAFGENDTDYCKRVYIKKGAKFNHIKVLVTASPCCYPVARVGQY